MAPSTKARCASASSMLAMPPLMPMKRSGQRRFSR
jgi:hypothetical protein